MEIPSTHYMLSHNWEIKKAYIYPPLPISKQGSATIYYDDVLAYYDALGVPCLKRKNLNFTIGTVEDQYNGTYTGYGPVEDCDTPRPLIRGYWGYFGGYMPTLYLGTKKDSLIWQDKYEVKELNQSSLILRYAYHSSANGTNHTVTEEYRLAD